MLNYELYDSISEDDRKYAVALESAEISLDRSLLALDAIMESEELKIREAELKCFEESGDVLSLMDYYEDAKEGTAEKKKGIIATIWDKIINFINKILGRDDKKDEKSQYAVDAETKTKIQKIGDAVKAVTEFLTNPIKSLFTKGVDLWKKLLGAVELITLGTVVIVGGKAIVKKVVNGKETEAKAETMTGAEINEQVGILGKFINMIKKPTESNKENMGKDIGESNEGIVSKIVSSIIKHIKDTKDKLLAAPKVVGQTIKDAAKSAADKVKSKADKVADKVKKTADQVASDVGDAVDNATSDSDSDGVKQESADDLMSKDFAELLASEPFTESADAEDVADMLKDLI